MRSWWMVWRISWMDTKEERTTSTACASTKKRKHEIWGIGTELTDERSRVKPGKAENGHCFVQLPFIWYVLLKLEHTAFTHKKDRRTISERSLAYTLLWLITFLQKIAGNGIMGNEKCRTRTSKTKQNKKCTLPSTRLPAAAGWD